MGRSCDMEKTIKLCQMAGKCFVLESALNAFGNGRNTRHKVCCSIYCWTVLQKMQPPLKNSCQCLMSWLGALPGEPCWEPCLGNIVWSLKLLWNLTSEPCLRTLPGNVPLEPFAAFAGLCLWTLGEPFLNLAWGCSKCDPSFFWHKTRSILLLGECPFKG